MPAPRAILLDFNGTLSDDEPVLAQVFGELFAELGYELSADQYYAELAGYSDYEIVERGLRLAGHAHDNALAAELVERKIARYLQIVAANPPVSAAAAAFVRAAAAQVPLVVVSGAFRPEIDQVLEAAGLRNLFAAVVTAEDVGERGKPDPEGYLQGLAAIPAAAPGESLAVEDSVMGAQAAKAAGLRCLGVRGTADEAELARVADGLVDGLAPALAADLFGQAP